MEIHTDNKFYDNIHRLPCQTDGNQKPGWNRYNYLTSRSVINTFQYIWNKIGRGAFFQIRDGKVINFLVLDNTSFENEYNLFDVFGPEPDAYAWYLAKTSANQMNFAAPRQIKPARRWRFNNGIARYDYKPVYPNSFGSMQKALDEIASELPNVDAFINQRDYPLLKCDLTEPYNLVWGSNAPLVSHKYLEYCPILSMCKTDEFADVLIPTTDDLEREPADPVVTQWQDKKPVAVFRGSPTGENIMDNIRVRLVKDYQNQEHFDVGFHKWNSRPRKMEGKRMQPFVPKFGVRPALSHAEQAAYKYIICLPGHVAAFRLARELSYGSVVLLVDSEWKTWYTDKVQAWKHYVPVKSDLSDLKERVQWCLANDNKCRQIATNAVEFYNQHLTRRAVLDNLTKAIKSIAVQKYDYLPDPELIDHTRRQTQINVKVHQLGQVSRNVLVNRRIDLSAVNEYGFLKGIDKILCSKTTPWKLIQPELYGPKRDAVDILGYKICIKSAGTKQENVNENFIVQFGLNALRHYNINTFAYVFTHSQANDIVCSEPPLGKTLNVWLQTATDECVGQALYQIATALYYAQNTLCFSHRDLVCKNVYVVDTPRDVYISPSAFARHKFIVKITNFGKSSAVIYEPMYNQLRSHGPRMHASYDILWLLSDMYKHTPSQKAKQLLQMYISWLLPQDIPNPESTGIADAEDLMDFLTKEWPGVKSSIISGQYTRAPPGNAWWTFWSAVVPPQRVPEMVTASIEKGGNVMFLDKNQQQETLKLTWPYIQWLIQKLGYNRVISNLTGNNQKLSLLPPEDPKWPLPRYNLPFTDRWITPEELKYTFKDEIPTAIVQDWSSKFHLLTGPKDTKWSGWWYLWYIGIWNKLVMLLNFEQRCVSCGCICVNIQNKTCNTCNMKIDCIFDS